MKNINVYELAYQYAIRTKENIFITGKAGTGKTTFLHELKNRTLKQIAVVAPTGVAAINAGGTTIHSFFQLPLNPFLPTSEGKKNLLEKIKIRSNRRKVLRELELLIIDEISMVRSDTLDAIDTLLRSIRYRHQEPFGGVQTIFIGDMLQLSPVALDEEWQLLSQYYNSIYFFHSKVILQNQPVFIELDKVFRQTNALFIKILNEIRSNRLTNEGYELLMSRYIPEFQPDLADNFITLTTHNYKADQINADELKKISGESKIFTAKTDGEFNEKNFPTDKDLCLKIGAKIMIIRNDTETPRRYYNGKTGIIQDFKEKSIEIYFPDELQSIELFPVEWENIRYHLNEKTNQIEEQIAGKFIQYPIRLAWAITIHKSQGLTFDKVIIDAINAFTPGQVYVAFSRCRSLEGIVLTSKINKSILRNDPEIIRFEESKPAADLIQERIQEAEKKYKLLILCDLFRFDSISGTLKRLIRFTGDNLNSFNQDVTEYLKKIQLLLSESEETGTKFSNQLIQIFSTEKLDEHFLEERINAAKSFFTNKIRHMQSGISDIQASTDSRDLAQEFNDSIKSVYEMLDLKCHLMTGIIHPFNPEEFLHLKQKFVVPVMNFTAYSGAQKSARVQVKYPALYYKLVGIRNDIADAENIPVYLIANNKSLIEMADFLPMKEKDLTEIHGFGKAKIKKYGSLFLDIITEYCFENNLSGNMHEKPVLPKSKNRRKK